MLHMPRLRRALGPALCTLSLLSTFTVPAEARTLRPVEARFAPGGVAMKTAYATGVSFWGSAPCRGNVTMRWGRLPVGVEAESSWLAIDPHDASTWSRCAVTFNRRSRFTRAKLCTIMVHELGHLLGHEHVAGSRNIMAERYAGPIAVCRR